MDFLGTIVPNNATAKVDVAASITKTKAPDLLDFTTLADTFAFADVPSGPPAQTPNDNAPLPDSTLHEAEIVSPALIPPVEIEPQHLLILQPVLAQTTVQISAPAPVEMSNPNPSTAEVPAATLHADSTAIALKPPGDTIGNAGQVPEISVKQVAEMTNSGLPNLPRQSAILANPDSKPVDIPQSQKAPLTLPIGHNGDGVPTPKSIDLLTQSTPVLPLQEKPIATVKPTETPVLPTTAPISTVAAAFDANIVANDVPLPLESLHLGRAAPFERAFIAPLELRNPQVATQVAQQISVQIAKMAGPSMELRLDPPELGRVIVNFVSTDQTVQTVVTVERPEVLELMRRHSDLLTAEMTKAGITGGDINFQSGADRSDQQEKSENQNRRQAANASADDSVTLTYLSGSALDIRL